MVTKRTTAAILLLSFAAGCAQVPIAPVAVWQDYPTPPDALMLPPERLIPPSITIGPLNPTPTNSISSKDGLKQIEQLITKPSTQKTQERPRMLRKGLPSALKNFVPK